MLMNNNVKFVGAKNYFSSASSMSSVGKKVSSYAGDQCEGLITWLLDLVLSIFSWVIHIIDSLCLLVDLTIGGLKEVLGEIISPELAELAAALGKMALENNP